MMFNAIFHARLNDTGPGLSAGCVAHSGQAEENPTGAPSGGVRPIGRIGFQRPRPQRRTGGCMRVCAALMGLLLVADLAQAGELCANNSFTMADARQGRALYNSSCGLCHQYSLAGRIPGNFQDETPDIRTLSPKYLETIDGNGGVVPPLLGEAFLSKWKDQKAFSDRISNAIGGFPPQPYTKADSDRRIAAYILFRNCGNL